MHFVELRTKINGDNRIFVNPSDVSHATQNRATPTSIVVLKSGLRLEVSEPIQEVMRKLNEGIGAEALG